MIINILNEINKMFPNPGTDPKKSTVQPVASRGTTPSPQSDSADSLLSYYGAARRNVLDMLRNNHLVTSLLDLFSSVILDSINSSSLQVTSETLDEKKLEELNDFLYNAELPKFFDTHLNDMLYYGDHCEKLIFKNTHTNRCHRSILNPHDFFVVDLFNGDSFELVLKDRNDENVVRTDHEFLFFLNNPRVLTQKEIENEQLDLSISTSIDDGDDNELMNPYQIFHGRGLLDDNIELIYVYNILEMLLNMLIINDTTSKNILVAEIQESKTPDANIIDAISRIEDLINSNNLSGLGVGGGAGATSLSLDFLRNSLADLATSGVKVVPGIENYQNFNLLDLPDLSKKKEDIATALEDIKQKIFSNLGIPQEYYDGASNKWEVLSQSSRYLTKVERQNEAACNYVKQLCKKYWRHQFKETILDSDIQLNIDISNTIQNSKWNNSLELVDKKFDSISSILSRAQDIAENKYINNKEMVKYIKDNLEVIDPTIVPLVRENEVDEKTGDEGDDDEY